MTPGQRRDGHRFSEDYREATAVLLVNRLPGLDPADAMDLLRSAGAWHSHALFDLHDHLTAHPDALSSGSSACPASLIRMAHLLLAAGHPVVAPTCAVCRRAHIHMPAVRDDGRLCLTCYREDTKADCARCGRRTKACYRRADGLICASCRDLEPASRGACQLCGWTMPLRCSPDGTMRCSRCYAPPPSICADCGRTARTAAITELGRICTRCYRRSRRRLCGLCHRVGDIALRATGDRPDICINCRPRTLGTCTTCHRHTFVNRSGRGRGPTLCQTCRPKLRRVCARCGHRRPAHAIWPAGPVCSSCYATTKANPADCQACGQVRILIGDTAAGPICGVCSGAATTYLCRRCDRGDHPPWRDGLCASCALDDTVTAVFGAEPAATWQQLADDIRTTVEPVAALTWLSYGAAGKLLVRLAAAGETITHQTLDDLAPAVEAHYVRHLLVATGLLPTRTEYLERVGPWLQQQLDAAPPGHATLVGTYARWTLLHRARRRAATRDFSKEAADKLREHIRSTLELLTWLDNRATTLPEATQADLDEWLTSGPRIRRSMVRGFLTWARERGVTALKVPSPPVHPPYLKPMPDNQVLHQLRRCTHDDDIPLDARLAGALILLLGTTTSRLVRLHTTAISRTSSGVTLDLGRFPVTLPPPIDALAAEQARAPRLPHGPMAALAASTVLFPGKAPGRALSASALRNKLVRHGLTPTPGRHAAITALIADMPTPVLADFLGVTYVTANKWATAISADWAPYISARDTTRP